KGVILYQGGLGWKDREAQLPVTAHTLFAIGSCTKAFTGVVSSKLVEKGLLAWDVPVKKYLPELRLKDKYVEANMTLQDIHTHMTGFGRHDAVWLKKAKMDRLELFQKMATMKFEHSFRAQPSYNNMMLLIAGMAQERVTNKTWDQLVQEHIFDPLGMQNSFSTYQGFMDYKEKSIGYKPDGYTRIPHRNIDIVAPAGAISSTPSDMAKWIQVFVNAGVYQNEAYLSEAQFRYLTNPKVVKNPDFPDYWGIGWSVVYVEGKKILVHDGGIDGQNAYILLRPEDGFGIVIMTNHRSLFKNMVAGYAEQIFVKGSFKRNYEQELDWAKEK
ncbi:MAG: serine hydrolase domain-containing protein, partial [Bacteroidota bacterium]